MKNLSYYLTFGRRYLAIGVLVYILSACIAINITPDANIPLSVTYLSAFVGFGFFALILKIKFNRLAKQILLSILIIFTIFLFGFSKSFSYVQKANHTANLFDTRRTVCGIVKTDPVLSSSGKSIEFDLKICQIDDSIIYDAPFTIKIFLNPNGYYEDLKRGSEIKCSVMRMREKPAYKDAFTYARYLLQNDIVCSAYINIALPYEIADTSVSFIENIGLSVRNSIIRICDASPMSEEATALLKGIMIGEKDGFTERMSSNLSNSGFMHIAAVSGMHTSYIFILISFIMKVFNIYGRKSCIAAIPFLILFASIALFTPSVNRAVIMLSVMLVASATDKNYDGITALAFSALILLYHNPYCIESASALMSYGAALSILVYYIPLTKILNAKISNRPIERKPNFILKTVKSYLIQSVSLSLCGTLGLSYFTAKMFGSIQFGSVIGSIFILPVVAAVFIAGYLACFTSLFCTPLSSVIFKFLLSPMLKFINLSSSFFSHRFFRINAYAPPKSFFFVFLIICIGIYFLLLLSIQKTNESSQ